MEPVNDKKHSARLASGYDLQELLQVGKPDTPEGFEALWQSWYDIAMELAPCPEIKETGIEQDGWKIFDLSYTSTDGVTIGGWLTIPTSGVVERGFVVGHGYAGRDQPDLSLPLDKAALLFLCARGISRSSQESISSKPSKHVLQNIQDRDKYVLRGCVEDTWMGITALLNLFPQVEGRVGYLGSSFGGGVGALALAWDKRVQKAYFKVPSFGNHPLRMKLKTIGSGHAVQRFEKKNLGVASTTLSWFDAAVAASFIHIPVLCACAKFDPVVTPPGQFAIYNAIESTKELFVLDVGHMEFEGQAELIEELNGRIKIFFSDL